jgi:hypothetical protein
MTDKKKYEDFITESAEIHRDLSVVLQPVFGSLKKAFSVIFGSAGFSKGDFKRYSDLVFYQGAYPKIDSQPKAVILANIVAALLKLESIAGKDQFFKLLADRGVSVLLETNVDDKFSSQMLSEKEAKDLRNGWEGAGIDAEVPTSRAEALKLMIDKSQKIQKEICEQKDAISIGQAEQVETLFKIKKTNFAKAVALASVRLKRGSGVMEEKVDNIHDQIANLEDAIAPLSPRN